MRPVDERSRSQDEFDLFNFCCDKLFVSHSGFPTLTRSDALLSFSPGVFIEDGNCRAVDGTNDKTISPSDAGPSECASLKLSFSSTFLDAL